MVVESANCGGSLATEVGEFGVFENSDGSIVLEEIQPERLGTYIASHGHSFVSRSLIGMVAVDGHNVQSPRGNGDGSSIETFAIVDCTAVYRVECLPRRSSYAHR